MEKLVTLMAFDDVAIAHIARTKLESAGIPCFLADANLIAQDWFYANALGGVKVQVFESDVPEALALLGGDPLPEENAAGAEDFAPDDESGPGSPEDNPPCPDDGLFIPEAVCPNCGGSDIVDRTPKRLLLFVSWCVGGLPLRWRRVFHRCRSCGCRWSERNG